MTIDWSNFTPYSALGGGLLIGLSAILVLLVLGRIAGISGILAGAFNARPAGERLWRAAFVAGLVLSPLLYGLFASLPESRIDADWPLLIVAGLLVGFGSRYGSGCTSGHSVCGISRLSMRSLIATLTFMATGFATVFFVRHLLV